MDDGPPPKTYKWQLHKAGRPPACRDNLLLDPDAPQRLPPYVPGPDDTLEDCLRGLIRGSGYTYTEIAVAIGYDRSALGKFAAGQRGLQVSTLGKIMRFLGLQLVRGIRGLGWTPMAPSTPQNAAVSDEASTPLSDLDDQDDPLHALLDSPF